MVNEKKSYVKVRCHACGNEQVIFGRAATEVKCTGKKGACAEVLAVPTGGKAAIKAEILELL